MSRQGKPVLLLVIRLCLFSSLKTHIYTPFLCMKQISSPYRYLSIWYQIDCFDFSLKIDVYNLVDNITISLVYLEQNMLFRFDFVLSNVYHCSMVYTQSYLVVYLRSYMVEYLGDRVAFSFTFPSN